MFAANQHQVDSDTYLLKYCNQSVRASLLVWLFACLLAALVAIVKWTSSLRSHQFELSEPGPESLAHRSIYHRCKAKLFTKMVTRTTLFFLSLVIPASIFIALFTSKLNTENDANNAFIVSEDVISKDKAVTLTDKFDLFWFIQVSDVHLNQFNDKNRRIDLLDFCSNMIPLVGPSALVLSGDITDSRSPDPMGSDQFLKEWQAYNETRHKCMSDNPKIAWLDIRGNHDNFNVYNSYQNYYKNFTVQGNLTKEGRSYRYQVDAHDGSRYSFLAVDACLKPGIRRPFNFIGRLDSEELERVKQLKEQSRSSNYTIWFGHYPTSSISNANDIKKIISGPYLCGHYHNFHGVAPQMFSTQPQGFLEAELGDWKENRMFRIGVVDGGLFTFSDFIFNRHDEDRSPLIVISNPRSVLHQMELFEPYWRSSRSTHIRVLVFSKGPLAHVNACITNQHKMNDNCLESFELKHAKGPLWISPWSTEKYQKGVFYITVFATNEHDTSQVTSPFSFDKSKPQFSVAGRISLRISFQSIGIYLYAWSFIIAIVPLLIFKLFTFNDNAYYRHMYRMARRTFLRKFLFILYILSHTNKLFYPLIFIPIYLCIGPWFAGHFVESNDGSFIGAVFMWGTYIDGYILPVAFTFIFSSIFLLIFHIPIIVLMAFFAHYRFLKIVASNQLSSNEQKESERVNCCDLCHWSVPVLIVFILVEGCSSIMYYYAYGYLALLTNVYAWISLVYVILLVKALKLTKEDFPNWL